MEEKIMYTGFLLFLCLLLVSFGLLRKEERFTKASVATGLAAIAAALMQIAEKIGR